MIVVACAVWGNWPRNRVGQGHRFTKAGGNLGGKGPRYLDRGGRAELQPEYILRLRNMVARHLHLPHRFICFADDVAKVPEGIEALPLDVPYISRGMPKAYVYGAPDTGCPLEPGTRVLMFDLDTVIVDDLAPLVEHDYDLVVRERFYALPDRWVQDGDVIFSRTGSPGANRCAELYWREMESSCAGTEEGDERILLTEAGAEMWGRVTPGRVISYKHHVKGRRRPPTGASVVSFHGRPLPDQAPEAWVKEHWQ